MTDSRPMPPTLDASDAAEVRRLEEVVERLRAALARERQRGDLLERRARLAEESAESAWRRAFRPAGILTEGSNS